MRTEKKHNLAQKRHWRVRTKVTGSPHRPRMAVKFTGQHIYVQFVDDVSGKTLVAVGTRDKAAPQTTKGANVINAIAGRVQYGGKHEFDVLASGWKSTSIGGRQRFEQAMDGGARWVGFIGTLLALR